jgi:outer membrane cobalamin receptor
VSLRGLSVNSTLVMIDGLRNANYPLADDGQKAFVDLNSIPFNAVERIETLKDGASSLYGADAIGGVVNIIMKSNYQGMSADASIGTASTAAATSTASTPTSATATWIPTSTTCISTSSTSWTSASASTSAASRTTPTT